MQKIDAIVPNDNLNVCDMAIIQRQNGRYRESVALLDRVLQVRPTNKKYLMELAVSLITHIPQWRILFQRSI